MPYVDLSEFLTEQDLVFQNIGPRDYRVPAPDAETGLKYSAISNIAIQASKGKPVPEESLAALKLNDAEEEEFVVKMLTQEVVDQMTEDRLTWPTVQVCAQYAFVYYTLGRESADKAMEAGVFSGKATAPTNRATRRGAATKKAPASTGSRTRRKTTD